ncbi:MAG: hypothetical protein J3K34DRAFT_422783 [Monoraphidium minutum]|nr:MAG: hypothetical protein J3K34DRAFT_422783 [Monoraphidium minutum]
MSRQISCKAYLKRLNITQPMAEALLPEMARATAPRGGSCAAGQGAGRHYELLFKSDITLVDGDARKWQLVYEGAVCNTQRHLRLTSGWRDFVRGHNIQVGDTVTFERRGDDRTTLYAIIKRGSPA